MSGEQRDDGDSCSGISASAAQKALPSNVNTMIVTSSDRSQPIGNTRSSTNNSNDNDNDNDSGADAATPPHDIQRELNKTNLRRGKWTTEEEAYARAVICDFNSGYLDAPIGTTLRAFLSGKLECDPMRITKKFTKDDSIGKKVFRPATENDPKVAKDVKDSQVGDCVKYFLDVLILLISPAQFVCLPRTSIHSNHKGESCRSLPELETKDRITIGRDKPKVVSGTIADWWNHTDFKKFIRRHATD